MRKSHRKDVIIARVIFGFLLVAVVAVVIALIAVFLSSGEKKKPDAPEVPRTESQDTAEPPENIIVPQEPTESTEPVGTEPEESNIHAWTTARVNMRSEPNTDCAVVTVLDEGTAVTITSKEDGWAAVQCGEYSGYIKLDYLVETEPAAGAEQPPVPEQKPQSTGRVVVIDPGHQRKGDSTKEPNGPNSSTMKARVTGGTSGQTTGVAEYELNLDISLQLRAELESRGYTVYMTRDTHDVNISNMERAQYATSVGADIAVRIHANGVDNTSASGALALAPSASNPYVSHLSASSQALSRCVLNAYCASTGLANQGVRDSDDMTGINWSTVPVTILEMGYMSNPSDDTNMQNDEFQRKMVQGIANGIDDYFTQMSGQGA